MPGRDVVVVGASAGGIEALSTVVAGLPRDMPAAVFVVLHLPTNGTSVLPAILSRAGPLPAAHAVDGDPVRPGRIYVARPDYHLLIRDGHIRLARGPRENGHRPAVDALFRSAARAYGPRVIGVVLSGSLDDGTAGLQAIKQRGGIAVVQDPSTALFPGMPRSALENVEVDHCLPLREIPPLLVTLASQPLPKEAMQLVPPPGMEMEADMAELELAALQREERPGTPSGYTCPECHGSLQEIRDGELIRFRCRVGHAYSAESLLAQQSDALEAALYMALDLIKERESLARRLVARAEERGHTLAAASFVERAEDARQHAAVIQQLLLSGNGAASAKAAGAPDASADVPTAGASAPAPGIAAAG
jgi:two-component system chemotaxis response regulator CheB